MNNVSNIAPQESATDLPLEISSQLAGAIGHLKARLHEKFERVHPGRSQLIRKAIAEAEEQAWETAFPHLLLPDFAELRLAEALATHGSAYAAAA